MNKQSISNFVKISNELRIKEEYKELENSSKVNKKKSHVAPRGILENALKSRKGVELRDNFKFIKNGSRCQEYRCRKS